LAPILLKLYGGTGGSLPHSVSSERKIESIRPQAAGIQNPLHITGSQWVADHFIGASDLGEIANGQPGSRHRLAINMAPIGTRFRPLFLD
jgi:hypothetical protein